MEDYKYYCPHCDYFLVDEFVRWTEGDPVCKYCNLPVHVESDPNEGAYDTLEEKQL